MRRDKESEDKPAAAEPSPDEDSVRKASAVAGTGRTWRFLLAGTLLVLVVHQRDVLWWSCNFDSCLEVGGVNLNAPGIAAQFISIAPVTAMRVILNEGTTGKLPLLPYSAMLLNSALWALYGWLMQNPSLWAPNLPAMLLGFIYTVIFVRHVPAGADWLPRTTSMHAAMVFAILSVAVGAAASLDRVTAAQLVGIAANVVAVAMFSGPLSAIRTVIRDQNTRSLPPAFTFATVVNCSLWLFYGAAILHDPLVWFPNSLGLLSGIAQLGLFARYGLPR